MLVPPSEKVTVPVGLATIVLPGLVTLIVAVKLTLSPNTEGMAEETAVLVAALLTVWLVGPLLVVKLLSPPYEAVMVCPPTARLAVLKLAVLTPPLVVSVPWPMLVPPSEKVTVPVGLATILLPGLVTLTVAVKLT